MTTDNGQTEVADTIRATERARLRALVAADIDGAAPLHADAFHLVTPYGAALSKTEYLGSVAAGEIDYRAWEITSPIELRLHGETAVIRYQARIVVGSRDGPRTLSCWHTDSYERCAGQWQVVWSQATAISSPPGSPEIFSAR